MKFSQATLVAVALSTMATPSVVVAQECTSVEELACSTDGFSSLCAMIAGQELPVFTTGFAPTDDAFEGVKFDLLTDEEKLDILQYHFTANDFTKECGALIEMTDGKDTRTLCDDDDKPIFQKGASNSRIDMPIFDPEAGIEVCGGTVYVLDHVLVPADYFIDEDGEVVPETDQREEVAGPNPNDGKDCYLELLTAKGMLGENTCNGANPQFPNVDCLGEDGTVNVSEQAGQNVTKGYKGDMISEVVPITKSYYQAGLCPVNVHWHAGAEHYSEGEYDCSDQAKCGPYHGDEDKDKDEADDEADDEGRKLAAGARVGFQCNYYDADDAKFTTPYDWKFCDKSMEVGQTYEVHWPHSSAGACGTPNQYQTPFKDGVFCNLPLDAFLTLSPQDIANNVGVQSQTYTVVNDEDYYYGNMFGGMIVEGDFGADMAIYTGSTTGTTVDNETCSQYTPVTWQVDRKCHLISASSFDKMCADMMAQRDDMTDDLYAHGSRELVADFIASNNQQRKLLRSNKKN